ncbi:MAG: peptidase M61, partial [Thioalkalispiraceae bacterium]
MSNKFAIKYRILPSNPEAHLFKVVLTIDNPHPDGQKLRMPAWIPGSYMIRDFARTVVRLDATANQQQLSTSKLDKSTWQVAPCEGP